MSLWDKIKNAGRSDEYDEYEDDYEREDEVAEEDEVPASRARSFRRRASSVDTEDDTPSENGSGRVMNVTTPTQLQVVLVKPTEFEDSIEIANSLKRTIKAIQTAPAPISRAIKPRNAAVVSILSASGSKNLPKSVTRFLALAILPSNKSVSEAAIKITSDTR